MYAPPSDWLRELPAPTCGLSSGTDVQPEGKSLSNEGGIHFAATRFSPARTWSQGHRLLYGGWEVSRPVPGILWHPFLAWRWE